MQWSCPCHVGTANTAHAHRFVKTIQDRSINLGNGKHGLPVTAAFLQAYPALTIKQAGRPRQFFSPCRGHLWTQVIEPATRLEPDCVRHVSTAVPLPANAVRSPPMLARPPLAAKLSPCAAVRLPTIAA